jgi:hypothetical protein
MLHNSFLTEIMKHDYRIHNIHDKFPVTEIRYNIIFLNAKCIITTSS